jgi:hypothetical protein
VITGDDARTKITATVDEVCQLNQKVLAMEPDQRPVPPYVKLYNAQLTKKSGDVLRMRFLTPMLQWVDIVQLDIKQTGASVKVKAGANSRGCCPSSCACAPLCSMLMCWLPFSDHGANFTRLKLLKARLEEVD